MPLFYKQVRPAALTSILYIIAQLAPQSYAEEEENTDPIIGYWQLTTILIDGNEEPAGENIVLHLNENGEAAFYENGEFSENAGNWELVEEEYHLHLDDTTTATMLREENTLSIIIESDDTRMTLVAIQINGLEDSIEVERNYRIDMHTLMSYRLNIEDSNIPSFEDACEELGIDPRGLTATSAWDYPCEYNADIAVIISDNGEWIAYDDCSIRRNE